MIQWNGTKAESILIPHELIGGFSDSLQVLEVKLENVDAEMLGDYSWKDKDVVFRPLIAFTPGLKYIIELNNILIGSILIPRNENAKPPQLIGLYPSGGDVPENLLKIYIAFSKPMQEGQAMENLLMIRGNNKDTVPVFLDLQQELWNKEGTILTLWLDPGRIKRGLQPNERLGSPFRQGDFYSLTINKKWRDIEGLQLNAVQLWVFKVGPRDGISPSIDRWKIIPPKATSKEFLKINLDEPLDYLLLKNTVSIKDSNGNGIPGEIELEEDETVLVFIPANAWTPGNYTLEVEARLEDLAGNNLNRLFDQDISKNKTEQKPIHKRSFRIE